MKFDCPNCGSRQEVIKEGSCLRCFCCRKRIAADFVDGNVTLTMLLSTLTALKECKKLKIRLLMFE